MCVLVQGAFTKAKARYGSPRIQRVPKVHGVAVAEKRVTRLMCEAQLVARPRSRFVVTTQSTHDQPLAAGLVDHSSCGSSYVSRA